MRIPFGLQSYDIEPISRQRNVNCHVIQAPVGAKSQFALTRAPGVTAFADLGSVARVWEVFGDDLYVVSGNTLKKVAADGTVTSIGGVGAATDMAASRTQLMIVNGGAGYVYDGTSLTQITHAEWTDWSWVEHLDGFFVGGKLGEQRFYTSEFGDGLTYDATDTVSAEARPDPIVDTLVDHRELIVGGTQTIELWYNAGNAGFPFLRVPNGVIELGIIGRTFAALENSFYWFASDYTVRRLDGLTPVRISHDALEKDLYGTTDATAFSWRCGGRQFYTLRTATKCWTYDLYTGMWHERETFNAATWRIQGRCRAHGAEYAIDALSGQVGVFDPGAETVFGDMVRWWARSGTIYQQGRRMFHSRLEFEFDKGVGDAQDPEVMLRWSDDDGKTWSVELRRGMGKVGEYKDRVVFHRLGASRSRVYEFMVTDSVPVTLVDVFAEIA